MYKNDPSEKEGNKKKEKGSNNSYNKNPPQNNEQTQSSLSFKYCAKSTT